MLWQFRSQAAMGRSPTLKHIQRRQEGDNQLHGQQEICYSIFFPLSSVCPRKLPFSITTLILIRRQVVVEDDRLDKNGRWRRRCSDGGNDESDDKLDLRLMVPTSFWPRITECLSQAGIIVSYEYALQDRHSIASIVNIISLHVPYSDLCKKFPCESGSTIG